MPEQHDPADDVALSALADGMLPEAEARRLRERMAREPALARRYEALRGSDAALRRALAGLASEPLPQAVLDLLDRAPAPAGPEPEARRLARALRAWLAPPVAVAATLAAVTGLAIGWLARGPDLPSPGIGEILRPGTPLFAAFQDLPGGEVGALPGAARAVPRLSFRDAAGRYCRQVDVAAGDRATAVLACRSEEGWQVVMAGLAAPAGGDGYRPAAGPGGPGMAAAVTALAAGPPLGPGEERALIARDWRPPAD